MQIVNNLHEMSNPIFYEKYFKMLPAEIFTQHAKYYNGLKGNATCSTVH